MSGDRQPVISPLEGVPRRRVDGAWGGGPGSGDWLYIEQAKRDGGALDGLDVAEREWLAFLVGLTGRDHISGQFKRILDLLADAARGVDLLNG